VTTRQQYLSVRRLVSQAALPSSPWLSSRRQKLSSLFANRQSDDQHHDGSGRRIDDIGRQHIFLHPL